jgi:hypothetical protein
MRKAASRVKIVVVRARRAVQNLEFGQGSSRRNNHDSGVRVEWTCLSSWWRADF